MKNKKMVATLASLCLIVVAVVAAVVGVLAAVTQNVNATFNVSYTARNVYASVTLASKGPTEAAGVRTIHETNSAEDWETADTTGSEITTYLFQPMSGTETKTLKGKSYNYGWDNESTAVNFLGVAIYQFKFENLHANNDLNVALSYTASSSNVMVKFYKSFKNDLLIRNVSETRTENTGDLTAFTLTFQQEDPIGSSSDFTQIADTADSENANLYEDSFVISDTTAATSSNPATVYVYMVMVLDDPAAGANYTVSSSNLSFTLTDAA